MKVSEFLFITFEKGEEHQHRNRLICNDGFSVSVQASSFHYCSPRKTIDRYDSVELGFPSSEDSLISSFAENVKALTNTVYGWVPIQVVEELVQKHGGIDIAKTFKM